MLVWCVVGAMADAERLDGAKVALPVLQNDLSQVLLFSVVLLPYCVCVCVCVCVCGVHVCMYAWVYIQTNRYGIV